MRIAFVSTVLGYPWGGADTLWTHAAEAAAARGDELLLSVSPAVGAHPRIKALLARGARLHLRTATPAVTPWTRRSLTRLRRFAGLGEDRLVSALARFRPDLIVISCGGTYDLILHNEWVDWFARTGVRFRIIANWQSENPIFTESDRVRARRSLTLAEKAFFVSSRNLQVTRRHLLAPLPNASVIQNPLRWQPDDSTPWPDSPVARLATVSRLDEGKGIHLLLHALANRPNLDDWRLDIHGTGPAEGYLRATTEHLGLAGRIRFCGHVHDLRSIWAGQQLLVSASVNDGVPMTIPEAMLCGRPVLATAVGGAEDWLRNGKTGFLCPAATVPLLESTLLTAFAARASWSEMGREAAAAARARYAALDYLKILT